MPWVRFKPMIPVFKRKKTVHAVDLAITVIGSDFSYLRDILISVFNYYNNELWTSAICSIHHSLLTACLREHTFSLSLSRFIVYLCLKVTDYVSQPRNSNWISILGCVMKVDRINRFRTTVTPLEITESLLQTPPDFLAGRLQTVP
jgi:hypothetical protein